MNHNQMTNIVWDHMKTVTLTRKGFLPDRFEKARSRRETQGWAL